MNLKVGSVVIDPTVPPNTTLAIPSGGDILLVIINEQTTASDANDTEGTINAVHVYVLKGNGVVSAELIVSSAHCDAHK